MKRCIAAKQRLHIWKPRCSNENPGKTLRDAGKTPRDAGKTLRDAGKTLRDAGKTPRDAPVFTRESPFPDFSPLFTCKLFGIRNANIPLRFGGTPLQTSGRPLQAFVIGRYPAPARTFI